MANFDNRVLALASLLQITHLVEQLATTGQYDKTIFATSISSVFKLDSNDTESIYSGLANLKTGLTQLNQLLDKNNRTTNKNLISYAMVLLYLERKLQKNPTMLATLKTRLQQAQDQADYFHLTHDNVIANLAGIYLDTISTFKYRLHVRGNSRYLQDNTVLNKIRALLLCGIRAAVLWRQLGGTRWQLLFARKKLIAATTKQLHKIENLNEDTLTITHEE